MQFTIHNNVLLSALKEAKHTTDNRFHVNVNLRVDDNSLFVATTDGARTTEIELIAVHTDIGQFAAPIKVMIEQLSALGPKALVTATLVDNTLKIEADGIVSEIAGQIEDVLTPDFSGDYAGELSQEILHLIIDRAGWAAAGYDSSSILGGVFVKADDLKLHAAATDGSRLTAIDALLDRPTNLSAIIPVDAIKVIDKLIGNKARAKRLVRAMLYTTAHGELIVLMPDCKFKTRLIAGDYPRYAELFPSEHLTVLQFKREQFAKLCHAAMKAADDRTNLIKVECNGSAVISACTPDANRFTASMEYEATNVVKTHNELVGHFAVNGKYVCDVLDASVGELVSIGYSGPLKPLVFMDREHRTRHLLMPVQAK